MKHLEPLITESPDGTEMIGQVNPFVDTYI